METDEALFIDRLSASFRDLQRIREEHIRANDDLLSYVFLGEVAEHAVNTYGDRKAPREKIERLFEFLEKEYVSGTPKVRDLIFLGIIENLAGPPEPYWRIRELLGPQMRKAIEETWPQTGFARRVRGRRS
jgi:hypothetical protein